MNGEEYKKFQVWNNNLKVGDVVNARFSNSYEYYSFKAKIVKINIMTVRVIALEKVGEQYTDPSQKFIIPRFNNWNSYTNNNGIFPLAENKEFWEGMSEETTARSELIIRDRIKYYGDKNV